MTIYGPKISASNRINSGPSNVVKVVVHGDHENKVSYQLELSILLSARVVSVEAILLSEGQA